MQPQQQGPRDDQALTAKNRQPSRNVQAEIEEPPSPSSSISSSQDQKEVAEVAGPSNAPEAAAPLVVAPAPPKSATSVETSAQSPQAAVEVARAKGAPPAVDENPNPPPKETVMEETLHRTKVRLRKARSVVTRNETDVVGP